jgi:hypothetical protein
VAAQFLAAVLSQDKVKALLSSAHFSVDGTLLEARASLKSFRPKDGSGEPPDPGRNGERDFHGERRRNDSHGSTSDPETRLFRKGPGKEARLCFMGHAPMENRNGLIVGAVTTTASGYAERQAALALVEPHAMRPQSVTLGADKGHDSADFVIQLQDKTVTPHVAQNTSGRRPAIGDRITSHPGYAIPSASANASRRPSAGPRRWPACAKCGIAGCSRSIGNSPSRWPPTISSGCPNCSPRLFHEPAHISRATAAPVSAQFDLPQKRDRHCNTDRCGSQSALKSAFFQQPASPD